jgi:hypothetical protein
VPGIIGHHGQPGWVHTNDPDWLRMAVALAHPRPERWWEHDDIDIYGKHCRHTPPTLNSSISISTRSGSPLPAFTRSNP